MQAGTGAWVYQTWWKSLPDFVEVSFSYSSVTFTRQQLVVLTDSLKSCAAMQVLPIELPGSGLRMREPRQTCMQTLVQSMVSALTPLLLQ